VGDLACVKLERGRAVSGKLLPLSLAFVPEAAMLSTFTSYKLITNHLDRSLAVKAAEKPVALEANYYLQHIGGIHSIDAFLKDTRAFKFAMKAFGLEDMDYAKGLMRKVLTDGVANPKAYANRLNDDRFVAFATTFNFQRDGADATSTNAAQQGVVDRYVRQTLETSAGEENEGLRLALYFQRAAPSVKSPYGLLADPALWKVVKTVFDFPDGMANADVEKQAAAVDKRLDVADLQDPVKLAKFIQRFTSAWEAEQNAASPLLDLFSNSGPSIGLDLVLSLHNLRHGGV